MSDIRLLSKPANKDEVPRAFGGQASRVYSSKRAPKRHSNSPRAAIASEVYCFFTRKEFSPLPISSNENRIQNIPKKSLSLFLTFLFIALFFLAPSIASQYEIKIPLGLTWGDSIEKLEGMAGPGGFSITAREETVNKTIITVHGLLGTALKENLFFFQKNALTEIEYRYGNPTWKEEQYEEFFNSFRRMYDAKYGAGTQLIHMISKKQNELMISLTGYQWRNSSCVLDLYYYSAKQLEEFSYRLVSLHYKAY